MNWKIIASVGVAVVAVVVVVVFSNKQGTISQQVPIAENGQTEETQVAISQDLPIAKPEPATGDIDETAKTILAAASAEESYFADAIKDGELIETDVEELNNFITQAYYENKL